MRFDAPQNSLTATSRPTVVTLASRTCGSKRARLRCGAEYGRRT